MVDPRDLGLVSQVRSPHHEAPTIYLYEAMPGGVGLSERLYARHDELVDGAADLIRACPCEAGCPACTGPRLEPEVDGKALALRLLAGAGRGRRRRRRPRGGRVTAGPPRAGRAASGGSRTCEPRSPVGRRPPRPTRRPPGPRSRVAGARPSRRASRRRSAPRSRAAGRPARAPRATPLEIPVDRERLARLPGHPPPDAPLVCLDAETTGLATAAGTLAFLVGLARWEGPRVPADPAAAPRPRGRAALLAEIARWITPETWLVTYNGRGFDWPLIEARFRSPGGPRPGHAGT